MEGGQKEGRGASLTPRYSASVVYSLRRDAELPRMPRTQPTTHPPPPPPQSHTQTLSLLHRDQALLNVRSCNEYDIRYERKLEKS